jgi:hypothetical protein
MHRRSGERRTDVSGNEEPGSERVDHTDSGVEIVLEDAGGRELRDVEEVPPDEEVDQIEAEREQRLAADNRPDNAEVDNTHRDFDPGVGMFTDSEGYDPNAQQYALDPESGG